MSSTTLHFAVGARISSFTVCLYLIGFVPSMSFTFSLTLSSLIDVNSDKDFDSTLEAVAFMDIL